MRPSVLLNSLALLAVFAVAAATTCSTSSIGIISGYPMPYRPSIVMVSSVLYFNRDCGSKKQGLSVIACWEGSTAPFVQPLSLDAVEVRTSVPTTVYGTAYCSVQEMQPLNAARPHSETVNLPLMGGALPRNVGVPGAEALPVLEAQPVHEAVPGDHYHQLY